MKTIPLNDGTFMPVPAFGTAAIGSWQEDSSKVTDAVLHALEAGFRHIDTASVYGNERSIGTALQKSNISRSELFITSKVWNTEQGFVSTLKACENSLRRLGTDYLNLYLVH